MSDIYADVARLRLELNNAAALQLRAVRDRDEALSVLAGQDPDSALLRLRAELDEATSATEQVWKLADQRGEVITRVRDLHTDSPAGVCPSCGDVNAQTMGTGDGLVNYPCPTIRALDGEAT